MATIDLNRIGVFVRVVEAGSFTAAAKQLALPTSSVSRSVANLESELGVRLLHRTTRRLSPTEAGQRFFVRMQTVLAEADEATRAVSGYATEPRGLVRISAAPGLGGSELPRILGRIIERYPKVSLELRSTHRFVDLVGEGFDLAVRGGHMPDSTLVARKVSPSEVGIFGARAYLERSGRPRRPADLRRHACLRYVGRDGTFPWRLTGPDGDTTVEVSGPLVCDDIAFLRDACATGLGLAMLPLEVATVLAEGMEPLVRVLPRYGRKDGGLYLVWPSQKLMSASVTVVRDALIDELTRLFSAPAS